MSNSANEFRVLKRASSHSGMPCVSIMRNEVYFIPHFLRHYRDLGVDHFIIYDDGSSDGTREYLMSQNDCMVLASEHEFQEEMSDGRLFHYHARTEIAERYCPGNWYLFVDADEFLFLPSKYSSIFEVILDLESRGHLCALASMVDFYPRTLAERNYSSDLGPLERSKWWFDRDAGFARNLYTDLIELKPKGIRARLLKTLREKHPEVAQTVFPSGLTFAKLWKVPLLKAGEKILRRDAHSVTITPPIDVQLALAHFKFYPGLDSKIADALQGKKYWKASQGYRFLAAAIKHLESEELVSAESVEFAGASSLEEADLMFSHSPRSRSAPARTAEIFGTPVIYERLSDVDARGELEQAILGDYGKALKAGYPQGTAWQTSLAGQRFQSEPMRQIAMAAVRVAGSKTAARNRNPDDRVDWAVAAVAAILPPGGAAVEIPVKGLWSAVYHLRVDGNDGGQVSLLDKREECLSPLFRDWQLGEPKPSGEFSVPSAPGLLLLCPSWCNLSLGAWQGKGWWISVLLELTPKSHRPVAQE